MNKKILIIVEAFVLAVGAASAYLLFSAPPASMPKQQQSTETREESTVGSNEDKEIPAETDVDTSPVANSVPATYVTYDEQAFAADKGNRVLFFHASWCPQCRQLDSEISANIASLENTTIYKVDYDSSIELRKHYDVTQQTTFVQTNPDGTTLNKFVAYDTPTFETVKQNLSL